jgi:DNA-binding transcriptional ArsR family regulator
VDDLLDIIQSLADQNRVRILLALQEQELCVCQVVELLKLAPSTVSKHLSILRQARLVRGRKEGRWMYYRLPGPEAPPVVRQVITWVSCSLSDDLTIAQDRIAIKKILELPREELCERMAQD